METASKNCKELVAKLTLQYNKARQQSITQELCEISGGMQAMREKD